MLYENELWAIVLKTEVDIFRSDFLFFVFVLFLACMRIKEDFLFVQIEASCVFFFFFASQIEREMMMIRHYLQVLENKSYMTVVYTTHNTWYDVHFKRVNNTKINQVYFLNFKRKSFFSISIYFFCFYLQQDIIKMAYGEDEYQRGKSKQQQHYDDQ